MYSSLKRNILPMKDWQRFLAEGKEEFESLVNMRSTSKYSRGDFEFLSTLGMGAFGRVMLGRERRGRKLLAIKLLEKHKMVKTKSVKLALTEKKILQALNHPFAVYLETAFQDNVYLFLALPFIEGGELYGHLRRWRRFPEDLSRFYGAQVLLALEYLHHCDMIFRDLKPENILVDRNGYLKLTDFGFCKIVRSRTYTLCGTPDYLAPEIILSKGYGKSVDWWSFGVLLYEMAAGVPPFYSKEPMKIYEKAVAGRYVLPKKFSDSLKNLISNLLQVDLSRRYGNLKGGINEIKHHLWFKSVDWIALFNFNVTPPSMPDILVLNNFGNYKQFTLKSSNTNPYGNIFDEF